jgi:hypothetical protein
MSVLIQTGSNKKTIEFTGDFPVNGNINYLYLNTETKDMYYFDGINFIKITPSPLMWATSQW